MPSPLQLGQASRVAKQFPVVNGQGQCFIVSEIEETEELPAGRSRKLVRFSLQTGENGLFIDANTFQLRSGEKFRRIPNKEFFGLSY